MNDSIKKNLLTLQYLIVAFIAITTGFDKIENKFSLMGWTILLFGVVIFGYFIFLKVTKKEYSLLEIIIYLFESIVLFQTTYVFYIQGKKFLPYATLLAGIGFLIAVFVHFKRRRKKWMAENTIDG